MDANAKKVLDLRVKRTMENLEKNNMKPYFVEKRSDVVPLVKQLLKPGETVAVGGSVTLAETGVLDLLRSGEYNFLDRYRPGLTRPEVEEIFIKSFSADTYISSSNAITENGELYNVDGNSNRVAAILYGPKSVIIVAGCNKIVRTLDDAVMRVKQIAAPANTSRLSCETYCNKAGQCVALASNTNGITAGCASADRICCNYVISAKQRQKDRIKVIIIGEPAGY
ncbi:MAG TPA: lactate utilization protein [Clostridiales bacterium]|nr:lactate utilization protein [Clostridiales bacterium]